MSYRQKQQRSYSRPNPWLHGAPPNMGGAAAAAALGLQTGVTQPFNNQLVNQLALANNLLTSALTKNQNVFGNQGTGLLGSAPVNFGMGSSSLLQNMGLQMPQAKRMRMNNQGFNQRNRNMNRQQNQKRRDDRGHDTRGGQKNNRSNKGRDSRSRRDKRRSDNPDDDERSYDPASPTSDGEKIDSFADSKEDDKNGLFSETPVGESFLVSLTCFYCNLCEKLYKNEDVAKTHCHSKLHCEKYEMKLEEEQRQKEAEEAAAREAEEAAARAAQMAEDEELKEEEEEEEGDKDAEGPKEGADEEKQTKRLLDDIDEILGDDAELKEEIESAHEEEEKAESDKEVVKEEDEDIEKDEDKTNEENEINSAKAAEEEQEDAENSDNEMEGKKTRSSRSLETRKSPAVKGPKAKCSRGRAKK